MTLIIFSLIFYLLNVTKISFTAIVMFTIACVLVKVCNLVVFNSEKFEIDLKNNGWKNIATNVVFKSSIKIPQYIVMKIILELIIYFTLSLASTILKTKYEGINATSCLGDTMLALSIADSLSAIIMRILFLQKETQIKEAEDNSSN